MCRYLAIDDVKLVNSFCLIATCLRFALFASFKIEKIYQSQNLEKHQGHSNNTEDNDNNFEAYIREVFAWNQVIIVLR